MNLQRVIDALESGARLLNSNQQASGTLIIKDGFNQYIPYSTLKRWEKDGALKRKRTQEGIEWVLP